MMIDGIIKRKKNVCPRSLCYVRAEVNKTSMSTDPHRRQRVAPAEDDDEEDPVEAMISKTGCLEKHYAIQVGVWVLTCSSDEDKRFTVMDITFPLYFYMFKRWYSRITSD